MQKNEKINKIMSSDVITAHHGDKFSSLKYKMEENGIHHLPVVSGKKLIGIISAVDLMRVSFSNIYVANDKVSEEFMDSNINLEEVMSPNVITLKQNDTIRHATGILATSNFNAVPIINDEKELVGMLTSKDLIGYLQDQF